MHSVVLQCAECNRMYSIVSCCAVYSRSQIYMMHSVVLQCAECNRMYSVVSCCAVHEICINSVALWLV